MALEKGTSVLSSDGADVGKVSEVVADRQKDIFSGIAISSGLFSGDRFVPADQIDSITTEAVVLTTSEEQAESLEPYEG
ncbi:MAG: hypothetical protein QOG54_1929 [Actinomycetota bacterium]|jgi:uncharacterized protein YrrD|nr:hypothetical protein [Actinomycetota bacterium]